MGTVRIDKIFVLQSVEQDGIAMNLVSAKFKKEVVFVLWMITFF